MPKKFVGENSKAVMPRQRKIAAKRADEAKVQSDLDSNFWREDNKNVSKKLNRKEELVNRRRQQIEKKAESKAILEEELRSIEGKTKTFSKITRAAIHQNTTESVQQNVNNAEKFNMVKSHSNEALEENVNRLQPKEIATTIDEALAMFSVNDDLELNDRHPEKRRNAAYHAFKQKHLPRLKTENPTLRLSQLNQLLFKEWGKSHENPLNNKL